MVVDLGSEIVFRQAFDSRRVESPSVSVVDQTAVGQGIKTEIRYNRFVDVRHRIWIRRSAWLSGARERDSAYNGHRRLSIGADPASRRRRNKIAERVALVLADSFVVGEEEGLILYDWTSAGGSELIAMKWRQSFVEVVSRVEALFANEPVGIPVELGGAGLADGIGGPPAAPAIARRT